jgi:LPXTG-motif cell wall-anchored protein
VDVDLAIPALALMLLGGVLVIRRRRRRGPGCPRCE